MRRRSPVVVSFLVGGLMLAAAAPFAAAAPKEAEKVTQGSGPVTLTAAERAKAEAAGIRFSEPAPGIPARILAPTVGEELRLPGGRPANTGTRLPAPAVRDRRKTDGRGPSDAAPKAARP